MHQRTVRPARRGSALLIGVIVSMFVSILVVAFLASALRTERWSEQQVLERRLEYAAENAVTLALSNIWSGFQTAYVDRRRAHWDFKTYLEGQGLLDQAAVAGTNPVDWAGRVALPASAGGEDELGGIRIAGLDVWREDTALGTRLNVRAQVSAAADPLGVRRLEHTVQRVFHIEGEPWAGLDYALLANNINCLMCHTQVDNARRFYNSDNGSLGSFERVKVGSLESLQLRESPESSIAGTLYIAGEALDEHGQAFDDWAAIALQSSAFDSSGNLVEDAFGDLAAANLVPADASSPDPLQNLYLNYNADPEAQVDGYLPDEFPSAFPDDGGYDPATGQPVDANAGNRVVDQSEFDAVAEGALGSITGGVIGISPNGSVVDSAAGLTALMAGGEPSLDSVTDGNVYLHGTEANPIVLDGDLAIDGDLILSGYVVGEGTLRVSGNVFIPSDILYADATDMSGNRVFGENTSGGQNSLAIASGGNVSIGDIFRPEWGDGSAVTGDVGDSFSFIIDELANFNKIEWLKTQPTLPGKTTSTKIGEESGTELQWDWDYTETEVTVPAYETIDGYQVQNGTTTTMQKTWFKVGDPYEVPYTNNIYETNTPVHANPLYEGPDYLARYYAFSEDSVVPIFNKDGYFDPATEAWIGDDRAGSWDSGELTYAYPGDSILSPATGPQPVVSYLTSSSGWMSDEILAGLLADQTAARDGSTFEINATIYSNNSVFGLVPSRDAPGLNGELRVNGSIVAADVGLLAPAGLQLNYDDRARNALDLLADTEVRILRQILVPAL